jgi:predicted nucleic acid-binding protein
VTDILIAATAHAHAARLYTRNATDLAGIENLVEIVLV